MNSEEIARMFVAKVINSAPQEREALEAAHGKGNVWDTQELTAAFTVHGFAAPFVSVTRKDDGKRGVLTFQHHPRFYFNFVEGRG